ncbi:hypothetical protein ZIOFF_005953 [Zingiber officinale]|uniref:Integrase catalytic domain-containing protein n=1 Tax=Zingiber officinale TaxID=94328 RepID=A0A8J5HY38_ZINOF|nr:hypothetical protein ZIOFF_005953 [Zingiber officinale]
MEGIDRVAGLGLKLLNQSNYRIWKTCMESYLVSEDLWDVVSTNGVAAPANITENAEAFKKWKQQNAKAEFVLKRTISHGIFEHVIGLDARNFVLFGPRDVKFLRNVKEIKADVVHTGTRVNDLFVLSASNSYIEKMSSNDNSSLWHARLGHLNMTMLKVMIQRKLVDGLPDLSKVEDGKICEDYLFGKAHRLPFESSNSQFTIPLERIHSDLMGPTRTASYSGSHYMLLFVDDYTRFTWVYFVKHKLETDDGGEFCSNEFFSFCPNNGIKREMSCPRMPQQNGVTGRKIRHLVETCKCSNYAEVTPLQEELSLQFDMKKLGELKKFLGLQIENLEQGICVTQFNYAKWLIEKFGLIDGKKRSTPLDVSARFRRDEGTCLSGPRLFRAFMGSLIYLTITKPDIASSSVWLADICKSHGSHTLKRQRRS